MDSHNDSPSSPTMPPLEPVQQDLKALKLDEDPTASPIHEVVQSLQGAEVSQPQKLQGPVFPATDQPLQDTQISENSNDSSSPPKLTPLETIQHEDSLENKIPATDESLQGAEVSNSDKPNGPMSPKPDQPLNDTELSEICIPTSPLRTLNLSQLDTHNNPFASPTMLPVEPVQHDRNTLEPVEEPLATKISDKDESAQGADVSEREKLEGPVQNQPLLDAELPDISTPKSPSRTSNDIQLKEEHSSRIPSFHDAQVSEPEKLQGPTAIDQPLHDSELPDISIPTSPTGTTSLSQLENEIDSLFPLNSTASQHSQDSEQETSRHPMFPLPNGPLHGSKKFVLDSDEGEQFSDTSNNQGIHFNLDRSEGILLQSRPRPLTPNGGINHSLLHLYKENVAQTEESANPGPLSPCSVPSPTSVKHEPMIGAQAILFEQAVHGPTDLVFGQVPHSGLYRFDSAKKKLSNSEAASLIVEGPEEVGDEMVRARQRYVQAELARAAAFQNEILESDKAAQMAVEKDDDKGNNSIPALEIILANQSRRDEMTVGKASIPAFHGHNRNLSLPDAALAMPRNDIPTLFTTPQNTDEPLRPVEHGLPPLSYNQEKADPPYTVDELETFDRAYGVARRLKELQNAPRSSMLEKEIRDEMHLLWRNIRELGKDYGRNNYTGYALELKQFYRSTFGCEFSEDQEVDTAGEFEPEPRQRGASFVRGRGRGRGDSRGGGFDGRGGFAGRGGFEGRGGRGGSGSDVGAGWSTVAPRGPDNKGNMPGYKSDGRGRASGGRGRGRGNRGRGMGDVPQRGGANSGYEAAFGRGGDGWSL
ncbi:hypothetical protein EDC01DRAFT_635191 [Geopyxis carbonaria]|nr:hypothetical protein EDC01DRAFT_635191 [Geopyxis carbonaria]